MVQNLQPLKKSSNLLRHAEKKKILLEFDLGMNKHFYQRIKCIPKSNKNRFFFSGSKQAKDITRFVL